MGTTVLCELSVIGTEMKVVSLNNFRDSMPRIWDGFIAKVQRLSCSIQYRDGAAVHLGLHLEALIVQSSLVLSSLACSVLDCDE